MFPDLSTASRDANNVTTKPQKTGPHVAGRKPFREAVALCQPVRPLTLPDNLIGAPGIPVNNAIGRCATFNVEVQAPIYLSARR